MDRRRLAGFRAGRHAGLWRAGRRGHMDSRPQHGYAGGGQGRVPAALVPEDQPLRHGQPSHDRAGGGCYHPVHHLCGHAFSAGGLSDSVAAYRHFVSCHVHAHVCQRHTPAADAASPAPALSRARHVSVGRIGLFGFPAGLCAQFCAAGADIRGQPGELRHVPCGAGGHFCRHPPGDLRHAQAGMA